MNVTCGLGEAKVDAIAPVERRRLRKVTVTTLLLAALATTALPGLRPAQAANQVLTFDDLGVPAGGRVTVNTQYSAQGVTFNNVTAIDYPTPGFAHSGRVGIEQCFSVELCTSPITANFTSAQASVKVWVGASFPVAQPIDVRLTAFDANHVSVGTADVTLPANNAVIPIQNPLAVTVSSPTIRSLEVSVLGGGFTNGIAVDDVEFSDAGPPPVCTATSVPTIVLTQPAGGPAVQHNEFLLQGAVDTGGAPIENAFIIDDSQGPQRKATLFPTLIQPTGGNFGPVRFNGLLTPGLNQLTVTATNCLGTGAVGGKKVTYTPLPAATSFRMLGLEVTQAVQSPSTTTPLIAATANSFKRTFVRVYLQVSGAARVTAVSGTLTASRQDGSAPGGPVAVPSMNSITVDSSNTFVAVRSSLAASLNFELPQQWLSAGKLHLQLDHLDIEDVRSTFPCIDCENPGPAGPGGPFGPALVNFHTVPPLRIVLVGVPYMAGTSTVVPRQLDFDMLASWLRRAYPTAEVQLAQQSLATLASPPADCNAVNALLSPLATMAADSRTRFYGLIPDNNKNNFVAGCSAIPGQTGSGPAGPTFPEEHPWDLDGSYGDAYGGHEIAHMHGRKHPGYCAGQDTADPNYPFPGGLLGNDLYDFQGFDAGDATFGLPVSLNDWRAQWHDVMTYCHFQWMSDYTYRGILQNLCAADQGNCPDHALFGAFAAVAGNAPVSRSGGVAVAISGTVKLATGEVELDPLWTRRGLRLTPEKPAGAYAIELRGAGGKLLARHRFAPDDISDSATPAAVRAMIHEVVAFPPATKQIVITHGAKTLASVPVSAHAPTVQLVAPIDRDARGAQITLRWRGYDADGDELRYTVLYSPDGKAFTPVATALKQTSLRVDLRSLPGGPNPRFEVMASDGVLTSSDISARGLEVPMKPPRVSIAAPAARAQITADRPITFVGAAADLQDGSLPASALVWRSSLDGVLGRGPSITATLKPGTHVITLTGTNKAGLSATATTTVTGTAVPPVVVASIVP
jgi:hypothetical protein